MILKHRHRKSVFASVTQPRSFLNFLQNIEHKLNNFKTLNQKIIQFSNRINKIKLVLSFKEQNRSCFRWKWWNLEIYFHNLYRFSGTLGRAFFHVCYEQVRPPKLEVYKPYNVIQCFKAYSRVCQGQCNTNIFKYSNIKHQILDI